jgi:hypothetical protein
MKVEQLGFDLIPAQSRDFRTQFFKKKLPGHNSFPQKTCYFQTLRRSFIGRLAGVVNMKSI